MKTLSTKFKTLEPAKKKLVMLLVSELSLSFFNSHQECTEEQPQELVEAMKKYLLSSDTKNHKALCVANEALQTLVAGDNKYTKRIRISKALLAIANASTYIVNVNNNNIDFNCNAISALELAFKANPMFEGNILDYIENVTLVSKNTKASHKSSFAFAPVS